MLEWRLMNSFALLFLALHSIDTEGGYFVVEVVLLEVVGVVRELERVVVVGVALPVVDPDVLGIRLLHLGHESTHQTNTGSIVMLGLDNSVRTYRIYVHVTI